MVMMVMKEFRKNMDLSAANDEFALFKDDSKLGIVQRRHRRELLFASRMALKSEYENRVCRRSVVDLVAVIPPLRGPARYKTARQKKSGRSGRDDSLIKT